MTKGFVILGENKALKEINEKNRRKKIMKKDNDINIKTYKITHNLPKVHTGL
jgi:hypothetical protein